MLYTIFIFFVFCNCWTNGQPGKFPAIYAARVAPNGSRCSDPQEAFSG